MTGFNFSSHTELKTLLDTKMRLAMYHGSKFGSLIGANFLAKMKKEDVFAMGPQLSSGFVGAPIENVNGFMTQGRTQMEIPVKHRLTGLPVFGDKALEGTEESRKFSTRMVYINRTRKAMAPPTGMEAQKVKMWKQWLIDECEPDLRDWWANYFVTHKLMAAIFYGASDDIISGAAYGGIGQTIVSHPNMVIAGSGLVSYTAGRPGVAGYEASVESAVNGLATGLPEQKMSVAFIRNMVQEAPRLKIKPIVSKSGYPLYPIFVKDTQFTQIRNDAEYKTYAQSLTIAKMEDHPLAHLGECIIDGALIISDLKMPNAYTSVTDTNITAGTVEYGVRPTAAQRAQGHKIGDAISSLDTGDIACCVLMGASALTIGTGEEVEIKQDVKDYENVKGFGIDCIKSVVRNDIYDKLGILGQSAAAFLEHTGSMVGLTYSPYNLNYNS